MHALEPMGVVPIVVNVGAALVPAVAAGLASAVAMLLRPRELVRACIRRPIRAMLVVAAGAGVWFGGGALLRAFSAPASAPAARPAGGIDWAKVARWLETSSILTPAWEHKEADAMYLSSPAAAGRWVYGASCVLDPVTHYGTIFCLDAATGRRRWLAEVPKDPATGKEIELKGFFSSPAVTADGKYVVVGQGLHYDRECSLLCFRADTGALQWHVPTPLHIESSPAIRGDLVVVGAGAVEDRNMKPVGDPGFVLAVRISDGRVLWRYAVNDPESSPAISDDGVVYIGSGFNGCELLALRTETDEQLRAGGRKRVIWRRKTPYPATGAVTLLGDRVIIGCGNGNYVHADPNPAGAVLAYDRHTGRTVWKLALPDAVLGAVAAGPHRAVCAVRNGEVVAIDLRGVPGSAGDAPGVPKIAWRSRISGTAPVLAGPAVAGEYVYAVSRDGYLAVFRAADGKILEKHYLNDEAKPGEMGLSISSPRVSAGRVYVGSETGGLRCFIERKRR